MDFELIAGEVTELTISKGYEDLLHSTKVKEIAGATTVIAASAGLASTAAALSGASSGADVDMEFFKCKVNGVPLTGRFYRVGFQEGDMIEFVVIMSDRKGEVYAARSQQSRLIWTLPYHTRGHRAQLHHDIKSSLIISAVGTLLLAGLSYYEGFAADTGELILSLFFFTILLSGNFVSRWPFYRSSKDATKIFRAIGFTDPEWLNLPSMNGGAEKAFRAATGEPWSPIIPLRYRYDERALVSPAPVAEGTLTKKSSPVTPGS